MTGSALPSDDGRALRGTDIRVTIGQGRRADPQVHGNDPTGRSSIRVGGAEWTASPNGPGGKRHARSRVVTREVRATRLMISRRSLPSRRSSAGVPPCVRAPGSSAWVATPRSIAGGSSGGVEELAPDLDAPAQPLDPEARVLQRERRGVLAPGARRAAAATAAAARRWRASTRTFPSTPSRLASARSP